MRSQTTKTISELVNSDTLFAIDDDDDEDDNINGDNNIISSSINNEENQINIANNLACNSNNNISSSANVSDKNSVIPATQTTFSINPNNNNNNLKYSKSLKVLPTQYKENFNNLSNSSTLSSVNVGISSIGSLTTASCTSVTTGVANNVQQHRFEVMSFLTMEKCDYCSGLLYGIFRQAVKCKNKSCSYICHAKCRNNIPDNCPLNINQRVQRGIDYLKGIGTLMQGTLKIPKPGGVKKGWTEHFVFLSSGRLFICPIIDNAKAGIQPVQIIDIRDTQFSVSDVNESDVIHANKRDIQCIFKIIVTKLKHPDIRQQILFCAKDIKDKESWINVLYDLNKRLIEAIKTINNKISLISVMVIFNAFIFILLFSFE